MLLSTTPVMDKLPSRHLPVYWGKKDRTVQHLTLALALDKPTYL